MKPNFSNSLKFVLNKNPIILHFGNVANNAHNSTFIDRKYGLKSFTISVNYTHVMGMPFWETEKLEINESDHYRGAQLQNRFGFPSWFLFGSWGDVLGQLTRELGQKNLGINKKKFRKLFSKFLFNAYILIAVLIKTYMPKFISNFIVTRFGGKIRKINHSKIIQMIDFADIIIFYGAQNFIASEIDIDKQFASFEHGTLRNYIWANEEIPIKSLKGYKKSKIIMVSNQDNLKTARELNDGFGSIVCTPHPTIDSDLIDLRRDRMRLLLESRSNLIVMPARHSSEKRSETGKGLLEIIEGIAPILIECSELRLQLYEWGDAVDETKKLILKLGIGGKVEWSNIVTRKILKYRMANAFAVIDQLKIPAFGAISTDAIGIGVPLLTSSNKSINENFFGKDAPIFATNNTVDIHLNLNTILNKNFNHIEYMSNSNIWYDHYLSSEVAFQKRLQTYEALLSK